MNRLQYILFAHVNSSDVDATNCIIALVLHCSENGAKAHLVVHTRPDWEERIGNTEYGRFARAVLQDWKQIAPSEAEGVFDSLKDASLPPLQAVRIGECSEIELESVLSESLFNS